ncbi:MAG: DEAD/DEAH box helicase family protein [archaeon]
MGQTTLAGNKDWLYEDIEKYIGTRDIERIEIPKEIKDNLNPDFPLREYQEKAFQMFISYFEQYQEKPIPKAVLFNMATGSGKTLIMAGLINYLYKKGYNNFLFFVNSNNIIGKTKENFLDQSSIKYLFNQKIVIDRKPIQIREVDNFDSSNKDEINICFTTIQKLHSDMHNEKENAVTFDSFKDKRIVLIADEAHHGQVQTKQKTLTNKPNWENTIEEILKKDKLSLLLEFTATMGFESYPGIKEKYLKRLLYKYDLPSFHQAGYSKDIELFRVDGDKRYRMLTAVLVNQYRQDVASKYAKEFPESLGLKNFKPVIMFKATLTIEESKQNELDFRKLIDNLSNKNIEEIKRKSNEKIMKKVFEFYNKEKISISDLIKKIQRGFSEKNCLNVNEESLDKKSISQRDKEEVISQEKILNSLESANNNIRAIFAVQKLNEGWEVLNLFDIVRVSDKQATGGSTRGRIAQSTISEAQLIGRGARYYPFILDGTQERYKRKFDGDTQRELRILEELYFHSWNESRYVADLKNAIREELGIDLDDVVEKELILKEEFKKTSFYKNGIIYLNKKIKKDYSNIKSFADMDFTQKNEIYEIYSGKGEVSMAFNDSTYDSSNINKKIKTISLKDIDKHIIKNALSKIEFFNFENLKQMFPNALNSINDLVRKREFLSGISMDFKGTKEDLENISNKYKLDAILKLLNKIKESLERTRVNYVGSEFIKQEKISEIFKELTLKLPKNSERSKGMEDFVKDKEWYVFNANYGTSEEKACVKFIDKIIESKNIKDNYEKIYLIRNELHFKIYDFDDGQAFAPDFVLFLKIKNGKTFTYQIFIEPKGKHIEETDKWKEKLLLKVKERSAKYGLKKFVETKNYRVIGLPFYNQETENGFGEELIKNIS